MSNQKGFISLKASALLYLYMRSLASLAIAVSAKITLRL